MKQEGFRGGGGGGSAVKGTEREDGGGQRWRETRGHNEAREGGE